MKKKLETIEPNPGPTRRGIKARKTQQQRKQRMEKKMEKRKGRNENKGKRTITVVTWNMQKTAVNENNRRRLINMIKYIEKEKWKIAFATEITAKEKGVIWLGLGDYQQRLYTQREPQ